MGVFCRSCGKRLSEDYDHDDCYRCRLATIGFRFRGGGGVTRKAFSERTNAEYMREHLGTDSDRDLGKRGIERRTP